MTEAPGELVLVRLLQDTGPIQGTDGTTYDLHKEDVVTLPAANARILIDRGAAEVVEVVLAPELKMRMSLPPADEIEMRAKKVLADGDPVEYLIETFRALHVGDEGIGRFLIAALGCQLCSNTAGIQPGLTGGAGKGKSDAASKVYHLVPEEVKVAGLFSDQALFYGELTEGTTVLFDDAATLSPFLVQVFKMATSQYQRGLEKTVTDPKSKKTFKIQIPPRCNFWITTVAGEYEDQVLSRQLSLHVDDTPEQDKRVAAIILRKAALGEVDLPENERVLVCRAILRVLRGRPLVHVVIPYAMEIEWRDTANRRNLPIFLDIIRALAALNQDRRSRDGEGRLLATEEDFIKALNLYRGISTQQATHLTKDEMAALQVFLDRKDGEFPVELRKQELQDVLNWDSNKMSRVMDGRISNGERVGGLINKIPGFSQQKESFREGDYSGKTLYYIVYRYACRKNILDLFTDIATLRKVDVM